MSAQSLQQTTSFNLEMENMTEADDAVDVCAKLAKIESVWSYKTETQKGSSVTNNIQSSVCAAYHTLHPPTLDSDGKSGRTVEGTDVCTEKQCSRFAPSTVEKELL